MEKVINIVIDNKITSLTLIGDNPDNLININDLITCINQILANTYKYNGNLFANTRIEVYQPNYNQSSNYPYPFKNSDVAYVIGSKNLMQFRADVFSNFTSMSQCFSHEFGHLKASKCGFDNISSQIRQLWNIKRGIDSNSAIGLGELFAEDTYFFEGSEGAKGIFRTNPNIPHKNPSLVSGLDVFYKIWKPTQELINQHDQLGDIKNLQFLNSDKNYFEFRYEVHIPFNPIFSTFKVDLVGVWQWEYINWKWQWNLKRSF